jgi:ABC-2 type transport system ATP-binding protein
VDGLVPWRERIRHVARIGVVFGQRTQLWWDLPVIDSFELLRDIYRVPEGQFRATADKLIALLKIEPLLDQPVRQLSLGQRMRCDIAASLLHSPSIPVPGRADDRDSMPTPSLRCATSSRRSIASRASP